jgi:hypothetical protein
MLHNASPHNFGELVRVLRSSLEGVFGKEFLEMEAKKLRYRPRGRPEEYRYLLEVGIHRAAKWWSLCNKIEERGYLLDLRFSTEVEELMNLILFDYAIEELAKKEVVSLDDEYFTGKLKSERQFDSLLYELIVGANYASAGYDVAFVELFWEG